MSVEFGRAERLCIMCNDFDNKSLDHIDLAKLLYGYLYLNGLLVSQSEGATVWRLLTDYK